jgi:5,10-methylenetetrahydromethanopterin reductase
MIPEPQRDRTTVSGRRLGVMLPDELPPAQFIALVERAEALGYAELWLTDQRFWRDCYMGLALAARHSERLLLGPGVNDPFTRHPATIAMAIATLDELSNGRAQLGLGVGGSGIREMRLPKERPVRALQEAIELIQAMLSGERVHFSGEIFHLDGGRLGFAPVSPHIPIFVATHSPQVLRLCGRLADGVLLGNVAQREGLEEAILLVRDGERAAGRDAGSAVIDLRLEACIAEDEDAAMVAMKRRFAARLLATFPHWEYLERLRIEISPELRTGAETGNQEAVIAQLTDVAVRASALVGSAQRVNEQLRPLLALDVGRLTIRPHPCAGQDLDATMAAFAEHVWPAVCGQMMSR